MIHVLSILEHAPLSLEPPTSTPEIIDLTLDE